MYPRVHILFFPFNHKVDIAESHISNTFNHFLQEKLGGKSFDGRKIDVSLTSI